MRFRRAAKGSPALQAARKARQPFSAARARCVAVSRVPHALCLACAEVATFRDFGQRETRELYKIAVGTALAKGAFVSSPSNHKFARYGLLLCAELLAALVFVVLSRAESGRPSNARDVPCAAPTAPRKLSIVFVDSLAERVARDAQVMPELASLAQRGVALEVTPCRDQLTYLLTGYDESSLLAVRANFTHEVSSGDNLLDRLARAGRKVAAVGSHDFEPYQASLFAAKFRDSSAANEALAISDLELIDPGRAADVRIIGLSTGDQTAHAFGTHSPRYAPAFHAIDSIIGQVVARAGQNSDVLIFGDHGHDEMGRHLPGLPSTSYAVYVGPSFRRNVQLHANVSDHRAILGVLLGVPTPPSYTGPPLEQIFAPAALSAEQAIRLPELRAPEARRGSPGARLLLALVTLAAATWLARKTLGMVGLAAPLSWTLAVLGALFMAGTGRGYDAVRHHIHDHGSEPVRSLWLLLPLAAGCALALARHQRGASVMLTLQRGAVSTVLVTFALLFPTAYYYGATRGSVLAAIVAVFVVFLTSVRRLPSQRARWFTAAWSLALGLSLWSLYGLHDVGGRTREMAYFVLSSPLFDRYAALTLVFAKVGLWWSFACAPARSRRDLSVAAGLLVLSFLLEGHWLSGARSLLFPAGIGYVALHAAAEHRFTATRWCLGLVALSQCYGAEALHVAPMQVLFLGVVLALQCWRACFAEQPEVRAAANGITLALAGYLLLWPTVGMRFSGIDFRFMFDWVPVARSEALWWLIGLGMLLKFSLPYALLVDLGRRSNSGRVLTWAYVALALKLAALTVFAAWYATSHGLLSNGALEILAELALLLLVSAFAWPSPLRALRGWRAQRRLRGSAESTMMSPCASCRDGTHDPKCFLPGPVRARG